MSLKDLIVQARSYRRFQEYVHVDMQQLVDIVDAARFVPSSMNFQPLRYAISTSKEKNAEIFPHLGWALRLKNWGGPVEGECPAAYIVIAGDKSNPRYHNSDMGIAAQTINLLLAEAGLSACMIGTINAKAIHEIMGFPDEYTVLLVIAIGVKSETIVVDHLVPGENTDYWREDNGTHHVPKRGLDEVLLARFE